MHGGRSKQVDHKVALSKEFMPALDIKTHNIHDIDTRVWNDGS